ncbi:MAG TPA: TlpA disulfide reductase family protein [Solirubrobacteraceae bacterium]|jgi:cytochrome c biogenesis protein CcmG/thiol:disulfide interchange protein DsbE|nr:TlpA disulfide reductase family protein [Solirubrobacteraceae bacterium]
MTKRLYAPLIVGLAGAALIGLLVYGVSAKSPTHTLDDAVAQGIHPNAPSAEEALPLLAEGRRTSLASYRGKVVLLNIWASWCPPCQEEAPRIERVERELSRHDGMVLGVAYEDATPDSLSFVKRYHLTYPTVRDPTGEFAHSYGTNALPESFVIDRDGHIVAISRGEASDTFLERAVKLAEQS